MARYNVPGSQSQRTVAESVSGAAMGALTVLPADADVSELATEQYSVTGDDGFGNAVLFDDADIEWSVSDVDAGAIDADGLYTAGSTQATYQVIATHTRSGVSGETDVTVVP